MQRSGGWFEPARSPNLERDAVIHLGERGVDRVDVAAVAVEPIEALEAVARQRLRPVHHRRDHRGGAQGDRARERHVMLRLPDIEGRPDQDAALVARALGDDLRAQRIGAEQPVRPMLLRRADGNENGLRRLQIFVDFRPGGEMELHDAYLLSWRISVGVVALSRRVRNTRNHRSNPRTDTSKGGL